MLRKGTNTMAGRKNGVTGSTCESRVSTQPYPHSKMQNAKTYLPFPGLDGRKAPMKLLGGASYANGELHAFHPEEKPLYSSIYCQWYYRGISER